VAPWLPLKTRSGGVRLPTRNVTISTTRQRRPLVSTDRRAKRALVTWTVTDDWPEVPVTEAEVDVFEARFDDLLDELLGNG
jgi:hypothetical protein